MERLRKGFQDAASAVEARREAAIAAAKDTVAAVSTAVEARREAAAAERAAAVEKAAAAAAAAPPASMAGSTQGGEPLGDAPAASAAAVGDASQALGVVLRGFKDLRAVLQPTAAATAAAGSGSGAHGSGRGGGRGAAQAVGANETPFPDAWKAYCATNPRLRDPKALPTLVRRGVPQELRSVVWAHCLGVEASAAAAAAAEALGIAAAVAEASDDAPARFGSGIISRSGSSPEVTPEQASQCGSSREEPKEGEVEADAVKDVAPTPSPAVPTAPPEELRETPRSVASCSPSPRDSPESGTIGSRMDEVAMVGGPGYLLHRINELIEADVLRTFPSVAAFQEADGPNTLRRVLRTLAAGDQELGYCQSMNFIAANFIMVLGDDAAAQFAVRQLLVKLGTRCWYTDGMQQLRADTVVLEELMRERIPSVYATLRAHRFDFLFVSSKWFMCLFVTTLSGEALMRVWDVMLCDGIEAVFRVALAMLALGSRSILATQTHDDLVFLFQDWHLPATAEELIHAAYDPKTVGPMSRAELAQRRRQAASQVTKGDTRDAMFRNKCARGGVRAASMRGR